MAIGSPNRGGQKSSGKFTGLFLTLEEDDEKDAVHQSVRTKRTQVLVNDQVYPNF